MGWTGRIGATESAAPIQNLPLALLSGAALTLIVLAGAVYWRPRIGLRAYAGIVALSLGGGGLFLSLMTDFLRAGYPGFGRQQVAGLVLGLLLVAVGLIALRGQAKRFLRPRAVRPGLRRAVRRRR